MLFRSVGDEALHLQQVIDIVAGAIDAWMSSEVRRAARRGASSKQRRTGEAVLTAALQATCGTTKLRFTKRDSLIGAGVMLAITLAGAVLGGIARRNGGELAGQMLLTLAFPSSLMFAMPFTFMKGQPRRAQVVLIGGTIGLLMLIAYLKARF